MTFTEHLWQQTKCIVHQMMQHPFNTELAQGTLATARFEYYIQQDSLYLRDYTRALALLAAKAPTSAYAHDVLSYAKDGVVIEQHLHDHFFKAFNISPATTQEPSCFAYTHFLLATAALESFAVGVATLLPCFWVYRDVGFSIAAQSAGANPYALWIETYTDAEYNRVVDRMIQITEECAQSSSDSVRDQMLQAFVRSTQCEWAFWDAAYRLERWPVS